jgi:hypothetical protein
MSAAVLVLLLSVAGAATAFGSGAAASKSKPSLRILSDGQKEILAGGLDVRVTAKGAGTVKVGGQSSTFDSPKFRALTKKGAVQFSGAGSKVVSLPLTKAGRKAVKSCAARDLRARAGAAKDGDELVRDTKRCKPKAVNLSRAKTCDFIGEQKGSLCMLPFPDNFYTVRDNSTATKRRVNFKDAAMPKNNAGQPVDAAPYNRNDGFSPGSTILAKVRGLNTTAALRRTGAAPINHIGRYSRKNQPIVVIDTATRKRWPIWSEIDSKATDRDKVALEIHPAKNFATGHRYIVALRNLKTAAGKRIAAPEGFRYYRDGLPSKKKPINAQRKRFESIFKTLRKAGIKRSSLYLAWDFTVASDGNIAQRLLHIRNDAFGDLGDSDLDDGVPTGGTVPFNVTSVQNFTPAENDQLARRVRGDLTVPCYLTNGCEAPARFTLDANGNPTQQGTYQANFDCIIPREAVSDPDARAGNRPAIHGHGLLGSANEAGSASQRLLAVNHGFVVCATDEIGFASEDIPNTIGILQDLGRFPELTDRVQQGLLNELLLGRLMIRPTGFASHAAFHVDGATLGSPSTIDPSKLYYSGISQGGILGGALTAVSPDFTRAYLGVPAMTYSVLLPRSVDFDTYELIFNPSYPDELARPLLLSIIQMLWDRSEPSGYANRLTDNPLPNTPPHEVLMSVAFGDHQVTTWQADVEARTIGASIHSPVVHAGRWPGVDVAWGIPRIANYPFADSAIVYWDAGPVRPEPAPDSDPNSVIGTDPPPLENLPNRSGDDPHGLPRLVPGERQMVSDFLRPDTQSAITDTCAGGPCFSGGYSFP